MPMTIRISDYNDVSMEVSTHQEGFHWKARTALMASDERDNVVLEVPGETEREALDLLQRILDEWSGKVFDEKRNV